MLTENILRILGYEQSLFEMANLRPIRTGLPMVIWISPKFEGHVPRLKVQTNHGTKADPKAMASVSIEASPKIMARNLSNSDFDLVKRFIAKNLNGLLAVWNDEIDPIEFAQSIHKI